MGPETAKYISGTLSGQLTALALLVKVMHVEGVMDANAYVQALKNTFNDPDAKFARPSYDYLQRLANYIEDAISDLDR